MREDTIIRAVKLGIRNARIESMNNIIKLTIGMGYSYSYSYSNIDSIIALIMLRCSNLWPQLLGWMAA